jgi:hypothetical protein
LKHLQKGIVERMMHVLERPGLRVVSLSPCFRGGVLGVKNCWNTFSSILAFETSLQLFFCVAIQQTITHFKKYAFLKVLLATLILGVKKSKMRILNNNEIKG